MFNCNSTFWAFVFPSIHFSWRAGAPGQRWKIFNAIFANAEMSTINKNVFCLSRNTYNAKPYSCTIHCLLVHFHICFSKNKFGYNSHISPVLCGNDNIPVLLTMVDVLFALTDGAKENDPATPGRSFSQHSHFNRNASFSNVHAEQLHFEFCLETISWNKVSKRKSRTKYFYSKFIASTRCRKYAKKKWSCLLWLWDAKSEWSLRLNWNVVGGPISSHSGPFHLTAFTLQSQYIVLQRTRRTNPVRILFWNIMFQNTKSLANTKKILTCCGSCFWPPKTTGVLVSEQLLFFGAKEYFGRLPWGEFINETIITCKWSLWNQWIYFKTNFFTWVAQLVVVNPKSGL